MEIMDQLSVMEHGNVTILETGAVPPKLRGFGNNFTISSKGITASVSEEEMNYGCLVIFVFQSKHVFTTNSPYLSVLVTSATKWETEVFRAIVTIKNFPSVTSDALNSIFFILLMNQNAERGIFN